MNQSRLKLKPVNVIFPEIPWRALALLEAEGPGGGIQLSAKFQFEAGGFGIKDMQENTKQETLDDDRCVGDDDDDDDEDDDDEDDDDDDDDHDHDDDNDDDGEKMMMVMMMMMMMMMMTGVMMMMMMMMMTKWWWRSITKTLMMISWLVSDNGNDTFTSNLRRDSWTRRM